MVRLLSITSGLDLEAQGMVLGKQSGLSYGSLEPTDNVSR